MKQIDTKKIEAAIAKAESGTTGELVVQIVPQSDAYVVLTVAWGFVGMIVASLIDYFTWGFSLLALMECQALGFLGFALLSRVPALRRLTLPKAWAAFRVHRECLANFTSQGLHETAEHTGILLYLSSLEHRVEILADSGIHKKLGAGFWDKQVSKIVEGMRSGRPTEAICEAIGEMGAELAHHFPGRKHNPNELSDHVRLGPDNDRQ